MYESINTVLLLSVQIFCKTYRILKEIETNFENFGYDRNILRYLFNTIVLISVFWITIIGFRSQNIELGWQHWT